MRTKIAILVFLAIFSANARGQELSPDAPQPRIVFDVTFLVFFDWNSARLTPRGLQVIADSVSYANRRGFRNIDISGHTDTSGPSEFNRRLSEQRVEAVAAEIERLGVSRSTLRLRALGETQPLVPTHDHVREPQNRYVHIIVR